MARGIPRVGAVGESLSNTPIETTNGTVMASTAHLPLSHQTRTTSPPTEEPRDPTDVPKTASRPVFRVWGQSVAKKKTLPKTAVAKISLPTPSSRAPSTQVTAWRTKDLNTKQWLTDRRTKENDRRLIPIRRAHKDLDWIIRRRRDQIKKCRVEVKNDKTERAALENQIRVEMEKLAVAPGGITGGCVLSENTSTTSVQKDSIGTGKDTKDTIGTLEDIKNRLLQSHGVTMTNDDATDESTGPSDSIDTTKPPPVQQRRKTRRGSVLFNGDTGPDRRGSVKNSSEKNSLKTKKPASRVGSTKDLLRLNVVETKSVWVGPGHFVTIQVERPPAKMTPQPQQSRRNNGEFSVKTTSKVKTKTTRTKRGSSTSS